jgi:hypothetical protein
MARASNPTPQNKKAVPIDPAPASCRWRAGAINRTTLALWRLPRGDPTGPHSPSAKAARRPSAYAWRWRMPMCACVWQGVRGGGWGDARRVRGGRAARARAQGGNTACCTRPQKRPWQAEAEATAGARPRGQPSGRGIGSVRIIGVGLAGSVHMQGKRGPCRTTGPPPGSLKRRRGGARAARRQRKAFAGGLH